MIACSLLLQCYQFPGFYVLFVCLLIHQSITSGLVLTSKIAFVESKTSGNKILRNLCGIYLYLKILRALQIFILGDLVHFSPTELG